ncbi:hypothetical protein [Neisseria zoodegmatis]|uniref:Periplasmic protein n=1 Tax=Neisseria zoodegmatis TaxID=326523 RepID=A0AB38DRL1_9NEIS|nr:hypothetical protein [Neisseria zoodegmatis]OSI09841.1 hypothetical protein BWD10_07620 [Neisseria zoodegmatis]SNU79761.1 Periplasmic protein [Neisseria zoodegmatis]
MKKLIGIGTFLLLGLSGIQTASAKIYTCVVNGQITYTSKRIGNCQAADLPSIGRYSSTRYDQPQYVQSQAAEPKKRPAEKAPSSKNQAKATPVQAKASLPPVAPKSSGNNSRRSILEQELANERKALTEAQQSLASARAAKNGNIDQQQITQLQGSVLDRQQNIQALQRELGRM